MGAGFQSALDPAGPGALSIHGLFWLFTAICAAVYLAVLAALLWALLRRRQGQAVVPRPGERVERRLTWAVGSATGITVVLLASYATDRSLASAASKQRMDIHVVGHQWWWEVRYDDGLPANRFTTANELHIPVGTEVRIRLTSPDVIHSFWVPNLNGKTGLIPGMENAAYITADRPGVYRGQCAEFCGVQHAHMALLVVAEAPEAFEAWRRGQLQPAAEPRTELERRGREVFLGSACVMCHRIRGTLAGGITGPDLTHLASRDTLAAGTLPNTRGHLAAWIADPQRVKPGSQMPITAVNPPDLNPLLTYLETLQ